MRVFVPPSVSPFGHTLEKRARQLRLVERRHQPTAHPLPAWRQRHRRRRLRQPPTHGLHRHTRDGRVADDAADQGMQTSEKHRDLEVDAPAKESHRRRQRASTTTLSTAAKPVTSAVLLAGRCHEAASLLALKITRVQRAAAGRTAQSPGRISKALVDDNERSEQCTAGTGLVPQSSPPFLRKLGDGPPQELSQDLRGSSFVCPQETRSEISSRPPACCGCSRRKDVLLLRLHEEDANGRHRMHDEAGTGRRR